MRKPDMTLSWDTAVKINIVEEIHEHRYSRGKCEHCAKEITVDNYKTIFSYTPSSNLYGMSINRLRTYRAAILNMYNGNRLRTIDKAWCHLCSFECTEAIHPSTVLGDKDE